jgi:hypothetical protein
MSIKDCKSAGLARACGDCRHARHNHPDDKPRPAIKPSIGVSLKCPSYVGVIRQAVRR